MDTPRPPHPVAHCALHLQAAAVRTCTRCGAFMCATCAAGDPPTLCPGCRARSAVRFPLRRDAWTFSELFDRSVEAFKADWLMLSLAVLVFVAVSFVGGMFGQVGVFIGTAMENQAVVFTSMAAGQVVSLFAQGLAQVALYRIAIDVLEGRRADLQRFVSEAHKAPRFFLMMLVVLGVYLGVMAAAGAVGLGLYFVTRTEAVGFFAGFALLVPAMFYVAIPLYFAPVELALEDVGPMEALRRAWAVVSGFRGWAFLISLVGGAATVAGVCACFVGVIPALAFMHVLLGALYLTLRRGSSVQPE